MKTNISVYYDSDYCKIYEFTELKREKRFNFFDFS